MKKFLVMAVVAAAAAMSGASAKAVNSVVFSGDTIVVVDGGDTTRVAGAASVLKEVAKIKDEVNSPLVGRGSGDGDVDVFDDGEDSEYYENLERSQARNQEFRMVGMVMFIVCTTIVVLVFVCLLFFFLQRRRKYRVMEKAIENNYEMPASLSGVYPQAQPIEPNYQVVYPDPASMPCPEAQPGCDATADGAQVAAEQGAPVPPYNMPRPPYCGDGRMGQQNVPGQYNLSNFRNSVSWLVVGMIGSFVSISALASQFLFCVFMIPLIVGLVKMINEFLNQRSRVEYEKWQMQQRYYTGFAQKDNAANQNQDGGVTPPPFNGGNNEDI